ncbi:MAG: HRDC domain-containing protein, partial [Mycolicibacterium sp.]|nr:HRDC domain-containing protein [Mycolicibacterium sp.]
LPTDDAALVAIPGIGAHKLERFGADVLALVQKRVREPVKPQVKNRLSGSAAKL